MTRIKRAACILSLVAASSVGGMAAVVHAQDARGNDPAPEDAASTLIRQMAGTWNVRQRMWPGLGAEAVDLPPAVARRHMMAGGFLEEVMEPAKRSEKASFTRTAFFNYNAVNRQYEYFSLDSRAPQMMNERSDRIERQGNPGQSGIDLNKEDDLALHRSGVLRFQTIEPSEGHMKVNGELAVVCVRSRVSGVFGGSPFEADLRFTRVWSRGTSKEWQILVGHSSAVQG